MTQYWEKARRERKEKRQREAREKAEEEAREREKAKQRRRKEEEQQRQRAEEDRQATEERKRRIRSEMHLHFDRWQKRSWDEFTAGSMTSFPQPPQFISFCTDVSCQAVKDN